ncbi:MAG: 50S ribosomal protein L29 [Gammaproteobacteria bacterium]
MKLSELRKKSEVELAEELLALRKEQFNLRMQRATGQLSRPDQFAKVRKGIARVKTLLGEQARQTAKSSAA